MATKTAEKPQTDETTESGGKLGGVLKKIGIGFVALLVLAGAVYWFFLKPTPPPEPGEIVSLDPVQINLADGHYLRLGLGLQMSSAAHGADGTKALDAAIEMFSGRSLSYVQKNEHRAELKKKLTEELEHAYHGDVMEVYFTEFVTQ